MKLEVKHALFPENEIVINGIPCDLCRMKEHEDLIHRVAELDICESCYDHYN